MRRGTRSGVTILMIGFALIISIALFPLLTRAKELGKGEICANNLKQIGQAILMYAADWDNKTPCTQPEGEILTGWDYTNFEQGLYLLFTGGYLFSNDANAKLFFCPACPPPPEELVKRIVTGKYGKGAPLYPDYWMRSRSAGGSAPSEYRFDISKDKTKAFLCDKYNLNGSAQYPGLPRKAQHETGWNVWYLDGHVQFLPLDAIPDPCYPYNYGAYFDNFDKYYKLEAKP